MKFIRLNLQDREELPNLFKENNFDFVCNLAAQPGVRYSIENPNVYIDSNIAGFLNILECCRNFDINRFVYGSSSSVYGNSCNIPFKEIDNVDKPISLYAASKKSNELMAHAYSQLFNIETIGLRFFTVYGPWGRPDMALFLFTDAIINNKPINVFNNGNLSRDFTFIDDIISGILKTLLQKSRNSSLYKIYNIGNSFPIKLTDFINLIEKNTNHKAKINMLPMQAGDVNQTWADINELKKITANRSGGVVDRTEEVDIESRGLTNENTAILSLPENRKPNLVDDYDFAEEIHQVITARSQSFPVRLQTSQDNELTKQLIKLLDLDLQKVFLTKNAPLALADLFLCHRRRVGQSGWRDCRRVCDRLFGSYHNLCVEKGGDLSRAKRLGPLELGAIAEH